AEPDRPAPATARVPRGSTVPTSRRAGSNGIPTRGLAAGLISKFNQMAAGPVGDSATIPGGRQQGRDSPGRAIALKDRLQRPAEGGAESRGAPADRPTVVTPIALKIDTTIEQLPSPASSLSQAHSRAMQRGEQLACGEIFGAEGSPQGRASPFLSDSEMDRALSEIEEFGRDMNLPLGDVDISQFDFETFPCSP
ncbi:hypothetical protein EC988_008356, partial [Linderina pennispora]